METKTADLTDAKEFADAIHEVFPDQMLAYNLSPSFNWDTTGMSDDEMRNFPIELGKMGFVFNFMTYGGHQIDGLAAEEFTTALREDGMLALARLQRKFRLLESPYRTPQTLVGGPRADAALMSVSGQTSTTKAMGEGSTQSQHLVQTEVPPKTLAGWLDEWAAYNKVDKTMTVRPAPAHGRHRPARAERRRRRATRSWRTSCSARSRTGAGSVILSVRDQNTFDTSLRRKRLMTLLHLFLIHRYKADAIHYLTPTEDNHGAAASMKKRGIFTNAGRGRRHHRRRHRHRVRRQARRARQPRAPGPDHHLRPGLNRPDQDARHGGPAERGLRRSGRPLAPGRPEPGPPRSEPEDRAGGADARRGPGEVCDPRGVELPLPPAGDPEGVAPGCGSTSATWRATPLAPSPAFRGGQRAADAALAAAT